MKKDKQRDNRIRIHLSVKVGALLVGLTLVLTLACIFIGGAKYSNSIKERYNRTAYQAAETAAEYLTKEEWVTMAENMEKYREGKLDQFEVNSLVQSPWYQRMKSLLTDLRENFDANDVFLCVIDLEEAKAFTQEALDAGEWKPIYYLFDNYREKSEELTFGDRSTILPECLDSIIKAVENCEPVDEYIITDTKWGHNISAILPVSVDGKTCIGVSFVEIPMKNLSEDEISFVIQISGVAVVVLLLAIIIGVLLTRHMIVKPIRMVANEANHFVSEDRTISDKLHKIKTRDEIQMLSESLLTMELSINDYIENIREITAEKERIGAELNVAARIQLHMLPREFDMYDGLNEFRLFATMTPAKEVGGDFYDFFMIDAENLALVIADVSGKGVPAALFMVRAITAIRTRTLMGGSPSEILSDVNDQLCVGNEEELFVTVWLAILNLRTGEGVACNAGHEHPALCHADGTYELVKYRHGPAVATMEGIMFREHEFKLEPGDTVFVYTDGVTEATDANNELFGEERTVEALNRNPKAEPEELLKNAKAGIDEFVKDAPQFDDITMLGVHYLGSQR